MRTMPTFFFASTLRRREETAVICGRTRWLRFRGGVIGRQSKEQNKRGAENGSRLWPRRWGGWERTRASRPGSFFLPLKRRATTSHPEKRACLPPSRTGQETPLHPLRQSQLANRQRARSAFAVAASVAAAVVAIEFVAAQSSAAAPLAGGASRMATWAASQCQAVLRKASTARRSAGRSRPGSLAEQLEE